ncbi:uncharacterized protein I206_106411 [Kwoniella pini CBS 10737]|uniref:Uncharacterized protein n=1 Tax=Kwoniella pini CBS 10737 TaxID=1296096 RepID=A0A1B9HU85_9TREE|nr:uncharacterized protein I206_07215 [Kwoniella pini CBS 10737]OCF46828.1 hypothetical protein I206_07215 [Kwoniella pini CBS 10737]
MESDKQHSNPGVNNVIDDEWADRWLNEAFQEMNDESASGQNGNGGWTANYGGHQQAQVEDTFHDTNPNFDPNQLTIYPAYSGEQANDPLYNSYLGYRSSANSFDFPPYVPPFSVDDANMSSARNSANGLPSGVEASNFTQRVSNDQASFIDQGHDGNQGHDDPQDSANTPHALIQETPDSSGNDNDVSTAEYGVSTTAGRISSKRIEEVLRSIRRNEKQVEELRSKIATKEKISEDDSSITFLAKDPTTNIKLPTAPDRLYYPEDKAEEDRLRALARDSRACADRPIPADDNLDYASERERTVYCACVSKELTLKRLRKELKVRLNE